MADFKFKYKNVEDIKERIKKNSEKEFFIIKKSVSEKEEEIKTLICEIQNSFSHKSKLNAKEMIFLERYRESLVYKLEIKQRELGDLEKESEKKLKQLIEHSKEHKILDILEKKHFEDFHKEKLKAETKMFDEIANQKFCRGGNEN